MMVVPVQDWIRMSVTLNVYRDVQIMKMKYNEGKV